MLRIFHNKRVQKIVWIFLVCLIGPAFIFWGMNSYQKSAKDIDKETNFGRIFGRAVSRDEYVQSLNASTLQMKMRFGEAYDQLQKFIDYKVLTIQRLVMLREADRRRYRVSDKDVINDIVTDPSFRNKAGQFDKNVYGSVIKYYLHMRSEREYEEQVRQNIKIQKLFEAETKGVTVSDDAVFQAYRKEHEQLNLNYIAALPADFASQITVTDQELQDYFKAKSLDFKRPLSFNLQYISTEKEHEVTAINSRLEKESLEAIAKSMDLPVKETGFFGETDPIPGIGWSAELSRSLSGARAGTLFPPLQMDKKYYVMRLKERKEPSIPNFEEIKDKVKAAVAKERQKKIAGDKIAEALKSLTEQKAKGAFDLAKTAISTGLKNSSTGLFKSGSYIEGVGASDNFYAAGRDLKPGDLSPVIEMPTGFYIVSLKAREAVDEKKFAEEKGAARDKLLGEKKSEQFSKFIDGLMKRALQ